MDSQGPCCHCGTKQSPLWICGPLDGPVLCNACGIRWTETRTLADPANEEYDNNEEDLESSLIFERINKYIPENEIGLGCMLLKPSPERDSKLLEVNTSGTRNRLTGESSKDDITILKSEPLGVNVKTMGKSGDSSTCHPMITRLKDGTSSGETGSSCPSVEVGVEDLNRSQVESKRPRGRPPKSQESPLWICGPLHRPVLYNACGTRWKETGTLANLTNEQYNNNEEDPERLLIFERINKYIPENKIGVGCMLLKPSPERDHKMDDIIFLKSESRGVSTESTRKSGDNNRCHPMITRLRI
ncbi:hypothetical protein M9H77_08914 [Catharanthus roseus]|uniref:Uncharacterized protein n=1 Tax=Catharanthus roseus TaxID=4058 RepID=A0ACC0BZD1_CATRO|nr:hypothetical protein M9H77_08914 [Catharanthus roseus]